MGDLVRRAAPRCLLLLGLAGLALYSQGGCTRKFYRERADRQAQEVLAEKSKDPWKIEQFRVYPDPRARFADRGNPDKPPMPPDDPAARDLSPNPQRPYCKSGKGYMEGIGYLELLAGWDAENREELKALQEKEKKERGDAEDKPGQGSALYGTAAGAPSKYPDPLKSDQEPRPFRLGLEQAVDLGLINSREFQDRREDLYLTALPVTTERFAFAAQFFATEQAIREYTGRLTSEGKHNRWRLNSQTGFSKLFPTGALLLFRFANQTIVEMAGNFRPKTVSPSRITLDLVQPLLRGGGQAVTLEPLTQIERNLLYEVRDYARFRKEFYVTTAAGVSLGGTSIGATRFRRRATSFFGFDGVPGALVNIGSGRADILQASGTGSNQGYLPTLLSSALLSNERRNVSTLEQFLRLFEAFKEGGDISQLQVDRVEQQLLQARNAAFLRDLEVRNALDTFKIQLGLPVCVPLELDDTLLRSQTQQLRRYETIINEFENARAEAASYVRAPASDLRARFKELVRRMPLARGTDFQTNFLRRWAAWERLTPEALRQRELQLREERRQRLEEKDRIDEKGEPISEELRRRLEELDFDIDLGRFERSLRRWEEQPLRRVTTATLAPLFNPLLVPAYLLATEEQQVLRAVLFNEVYNDFVLLLLEARNQRIEEVQRTWPMLARLCLGGVDLHKADLEQVQDLVVQAALHNRLDLMNARALLMDSWRQIRVAANSLLGGLTVEYHLDSSTPSTLAEPFNFSGSRTRHQLVLNGELPLVRIQERNGYRASLIAWQRQRRNLMATEDAIAAGVRSQVRQLRVLAENYRIQQRAVELAYLQVENALDTFRAPPTPSAQPLATATAGNSAALTQQLLEAQQNLNRAQNALLTVWTQYLTTRMQLYRDLELMPLDYRGVWTDDVACECPPAAADPADQRPADERLPPPTPAQKGPAVDDGSR